MQIIILAAGSGSRLGAAANGTAKALLPLAGRTLVARAIEFASWLGASRIVVVGGFQFAALRAHVDALAHPGVQMVENTHFLHGNLKSLRRALPIDDDLLVTNADHVFASSACEPILAAMDDAVTAYCQFDREFAADEMKVEVDTNRDLRRIAKTLTAFDGAYIGLTYVPRARNPCWTDAIEAAARRWGDTAVAEHVLQELADCGERVAAASLDAIRWCEIDTQDDYLHAQAMCEAGLV